MDMLTASLLERLFATSIHTAALAAVVWGLCRSLPLPPAAQCWLWWLVTLQAVLGLFAMPIELAWLPQTAAQALEPASLATIAPTTDPVVAAPATTGTPLSWPLILAAAWLAGVLVMCGTTLREWRRGRTLLELSSPCADAALMQALALAADAHGLRSRPRLRMSDRIDSPQLIGAWRPVLLLPSGVSLGDDDLDMALTHELVHLQRGDLWWGWIPTLARHLFFFHPLVHLAIREYGIAREAACDAAVVAGDRQSRHDYGRLLVRLGVAPHGHGGLASASPTFHSLKRRLTMLQTASAFPRAGTIALLSAVAVIGVLPLRLVAAPAAEPQATSGYVYVTSTDADRAFVRIDGGQSGIVMSGSTDEVAQARRSIGPLGNALWVRQGEARYVIRDRDLLQRFDALFDPVTRLGQEQGELGNRQGELGAQQGRLGLEQGELGQQQARIALDTARRALDGERTPESATTRREQAELQARQQALSEQQRELGLQQSELGHQQSALGERQREANARAHAGAWQLFDEALSNRLAERVDH